MDPYLQDFNFCIFWWSWRHTIIFCWNFEWDPKSNLGLALEQCGLHWTGGDTQKADKKKGGCMIVEVTRGEGFHKIQNTSRRHLSIAPILQGYISFTRDAQYGRKEMDPSVIRSLSSCLILGIVNFIQFLTKCPRINLCSFVASLIITTTNLAPFPDNESHNNNIS